jgi:hypothetical protein
MDKSILETIIMGTNGTILDFSDGMIDVLSNERLNHEDRMEFFLAVICQELKALKK